MVLRHLTARAREYYASKRRISQIVRATKIVIGAGGTSFADWCSVEQKDLDVTNVSDFSKYWKPGSREAFLAEHVWEHLTTEQGRIGLKNCHDFLKINGHLRIAVPDGYFPDQNYIDYVKPGGHGAGADDHKVLYTIDTLVPLIESVGFAAKPLEYFNDQGVFVSEPFNATDGYIDRCRENDPRNVKGILKYTSLIIDAVKIS